MQIRVEAPANKVREALSEALGADELSQLSIEQAKRDPFDVDDRGEAITFTTIVTWTALAAAGGVVGNVAHDGLKTAAGILVEKFGKRVVREEGDAPADDTTPTA